MSSSSILFLGTSAFAIPSLRELHQNHFDVKAVVTKPDRPAGRGKKLVPTPVKKEAIELNFRLYQPGNAKELLAVLNELEPQVIINVAYGMIFPSCILQFPTLGCINLHPSLLPAYRGPNPIGRVLMNGEKVTGITVMFMSPSVDSGDIVLQEKVEIGFEENFGALHDRLALKGAYLLHKAVVLLSDGRAEKISQDEEKATYAPSFRKEEQLIFWNNTAVDIYNQIRALSPSPGAYTFYQGKRLKILKTFLPEEFSSGKAESQSGTLPGTICAVGEDFLEVVTGKGVLRIKEVQLEGKKSMNAEAFLKGNKLQVGEKFEHPQFKYN